MNISRRRFMHVAAAPLAASKAKQKVWVVPNFHPASCGWLTNFSKERVYCANSYFDHLDRVRDDPGYAFVLSECNNLIAMMNFKPGRMAELRQRIRERRVELVNGFFLESTVNLSGGEALVRLGVEGIRWQQQIFGVRPRVGWVIDICGTHDQMAQICAGLGFDAMVYTRKNPTGSAAHWAESPDGSRILALAPGHYAEFKQLFAAKAPLGPNEMQELRKNLDSRRKITPEGAPVLILGGAADYSLAPPVKEYPRAFLRQWEDFDSTYGVRFGTMSHYLDEVLPLLKAGTLNIPVMRGGTEYDFLAFWIQCPKVKSWYRRNEHALQAAEALSTIASLTSPHRYPVQSLYHAWLQMFLNMDRNTLWGAAGGMVFEHDRSWDARDRFEWVEKAAREHQQASARAIAPRGKLVGVFNPANWTRRDPVVLDLPDGVSLEGVPCQALEDGRVFVQPELPGLAMSRLAPSRAPAPAGKALPLPETIETRFYAARIDPKTGDLASLRVKPSGREMLGGPANRIVFERPIDQRGDPGDHMRPRPQRKILTTSAEGPVELRVCSGPLMTVVEATGALGKRRIFFYHDHPRIDFETELTDVPDRTVVTTEFPLADAIAEVRRGIPYGFSRGAMKSITPAVRWSHYELGAGGGLALFDRGSSGRELVERTPILYLLNASDKYYGFPNSWLSGKGRHLLCYAAAAHESPWRNAGIPRMAWEYNAPPILVPDVAEGTARPFVETSDNVIVECLRRDGRDIELRLVECSGEAGQAEVSVRLPHSRAFLTDMMGGSATGIRGGPRYRFPIRAQQIVTMRLRTASAVPAAKPLTEWDELAPPHKRPALREYSDEKGHPPKGV